MIRKIKRENSGLMKAGQDLVVAGYAGLAGTCAIISARRRELERWFAPAYLDGLISYENREDVLERHKDGKIFEATEWEPAGDGGILTAVWNLLGAYGLGAEFSLRRIPIKQGTIEICERMGLNPYRLYSRGCYLLASENGGRTARLLAGRGVAAGVVGSVTGGIAKIITDGGERSFLNRPVPDELGKAVGTCLRGETSQNGG